MEKLKQNPKVLDNFRWVYLSNVSAENKGKITLKRQGDMPTGKMIHFSKRKLKICECNHVYKRQKWKKLQNNLYI